jgi:hypothetical protein
MYLAMGEDRSRIVQQEVPRLPPLSPLLNPHHSTSILKQEPEEYHGSATKLTTYDDQLSLDSFLDLFIRMMYFKGWVLRIDMQVGFFILSGWLPETPMLG